MGCSASSSPSQYGSNSSPDQIPVPQDPVPYAGPKCRYHLIQCFVNVDPSIAGSWPQVNYISNVDSHYQTLGQTYSSGFRLLSFYCIPNTVRRVMLSPTATFTYYGIYFQAQQPSKPPNEQWQLTVVKSEMQVQVIRHGLLQAETHGNTGNITAAIAEMASRGGRLVCIENTQKRLAQTIQQGFTGLGPVQGVDVFLEMPLHPNPTMYTYTVANVPIVVQIGFGGLTVSCDWNGVFKQYLDAGWCLKEIYIDQGSTARAFSTSQTINSLWFFEKNSTLLEDNRPRYQGTIVFYELKSSVQQTTNLVANTDNWGDLLSAMGDNGWELSCVLDTPQVRRSGLYSFYTTLLFFFQREMF